MTRKELEATEMWFLQRMIGIPWADEKNNFEVMQEVNS